MKMIISLAFACLLATESTAQQPTFVYPTQAALAEGESSVDSHVGGVPWWSKVAQGPFSQHFRMQLITDLPSTFNGSISSISFRRDGETLPGFKLEQFSVDLEITMSVAPTTAATASAAFANNSGANKVVVLPRNRIILGAKLFQGTFPEPFVYTIKFANPFPYNAAQGSLCIDVKHYSNDMMVPQRLTPLTVAVDAMTGSKDAATLTNGSRCASPNEWLPPTELHTEMFVDDSGSPDLRFYAWRQFGQHHSRGFLILSLALLPSPGIPVPGFGAGGCGYIQLDLGQQFLPIFISDSDDYGRVRWPSVAQGGYLWQLPYNPTWGGFKFYAQELNYNVHTQAYAATNWVATQIPVYLGNQNFPIRVVYADGPTSHTATMGTLGQVGVGPVIQYN